MIDLNGKHALVCGATQGMGKSCALAMARCGARVTLAARNPQSLAACLAELDTTANRQHATICQDFTEPAALAAKVSAHVEQNGPVHILLNNTGGPQAGPIIDAAPRDFLDAINQHVVVNQLLAQTLVPGMKRAGYGRIINIISTSVKTPIPGLGVSNTTRAAVAGWAKTLASELAPFGITVNNILPGFIETGRIHDVIRARAAQLGQPQERVHKAFLAQVPAGRFGSPQEVANVACFLASPAASYVTGINLPVDGGRTPTL